MWPANHVVERRSAPPRPRPPAALALAAAILLACSGAPTDAPPSKEAQFDAVWSDFDLTYPYFGIAGVDWAAARETYRPRAAAARSEAELAAVLVEMLGQLRDLHVVLIDPQGRSIRTWSRVFDPNFDRTVWSTYAARWGAVAHGTWGYGWIGDAVPYVWIDQWTQPLAGFAEAMETFRDAPGLVVDVRMNGGGNSLYAIPVLQRIFDKTRVVGLARYRNGPGHEDFGPFEAATMSPGGAWQFTRPILVLVGPASVSSTEGFTSAVRELPHVTIAGATTGGATANPAERPLAEGWSYRISQWFFTTPDGIVVQGHGIPPHVSVPAGAADFASGVDPVLDYAEAWAAQPRVLRP